MQGIGPNYVLIGGIFDLTVKRRVIYIYIYIYIICNACTCS